MNEITGISESYGTAWADPAHDARGNMTTVPKPNDPANAFACKYDAWNRLTEVREGGIVIAEYRYDAMNRYLYTRFKDRQRAAFEAKCAMYCKERYEEDYGLVPVHFEPGK